MVYQHFPRVFQGIQHLQKPTVSLWAPTTHSRRDVIGSHDTTFVADQHLANRLAIDQCSHETCINV